MDRRTRLILRIVFAVVGSLGALLGIGMLAFITLLRPPGNHLDALKGSFAYLAIALIRFIAVWRLKPTVARREFDVISDKQM